MDARNPRNTRHKTPVNATNNPQIASLASSSRSQPNLVGATPAATASQSKSTSNLSGKASTKSPSPVLRTSRENSVQASEGKRPSSTEPSGDSAACLCTWFLNNKSKKTCPDCRAPVSQQPAPSYLVGKRE
ncbi:MAG: hypothetical protein Q9157_003409 [Trypethelium eluteriae]